MIITILCAVLSVIFVFLVVLSFDKELDILAAVCCVIAIVLLIISILGIGLGISNCVNYDIDHASAVDEYNAIVYRLEKQEKLDTNHYNINGGAYVDALEFNKKVRSYKKYGANLWTNFFHGWAYEGLQEIDTPFYGGET